MSGTNEIQESGHVTETHRTGQLSVQLQPTEEPSPRRAEIVGLQETGILFWESGVWIHSGSSTVRKRVWLSLSAADPSWTSTVGGGRVCLGEWLENAGHARTALLWVR